VFKLIKFILISMLVFGCFCDSNKRHSQVIKVYKVRKSELSSSRSFDGTGSHSTYASSTSSPSNSSDKWWLFYYILWTNMNNCGGSCNYCCSKTPISDFSKAIWTPSNNPPVDIKDVKDVEEETKMEEKVEVEEPVTAEDGKVEAVETQNEPANEASTTESSSEPNTSTESSSSDVGSSDAGSSGGDAGGGGDGGGGGGGD